MNNPFKLTFLTMLISLSTFSQIKSYIIAIDSITIPQLGGLQSFAFGQDSGKWLIIGGRLDGLHRRQPFASFDLAGHNDQLIVIDPISKQKWTANLTTLASSIQEQLRSTNMEFYQEGKYLYCLGGYGYSATKGDHTTFDKLTAINVPQVINAIINGTNFDTYFRQIKDTKFQVTGGRLKKLYNDFYLLGGQKFIGRYNPMGPSHGPGFIQEYTNSIRVFSLLDDGTSITINHLPSYTDSKNLHRRDYNAESQIMPDGKEGITMFSGVFQETANLPFLNCVNVDSNGYAVNNSFKQYYNHYHCPAIPMYDSLKNEMHTIFFGGIAQYYDDKGTLIQDNNVPFVKTIARVTRDSNEVMTEHKLSIEMPALLGAGAEFIPNLDLTYYDNEVLKMNSLTEDSTLVGHIYGGISSTSSNIFFVNNGSQSSASSQIYTIYLVKDTAVSLEEINQKSTGTLNMRVYPNPNKGILSINYFLKKASDVKLTILDSKGELIEVLVFENKNSGKYSINLEIPEGSNDGLYFITLETSYEKFTQKVIQKK